MSGENQTTSGNLCFFAILWPMTSQINPLYTLGDIRAFYQFASSSSSSTSSSVSSISSISWILMHPSPRQFAPWQKFSPSSKQQATMFHLWRAWDSPHAVLRNRAYKSRKNDYRNIWYHLHIMHDLIRNILRMTKWLKLDLWNEDNVGIGWPGLLSKVCQHLVEGLHLGLLWGRQVAKTNSMALL